MTSQQDLLNLLEYLFFKYLEKEKAEKLLSEFLDAQAEGRNIGKHCLHVLTSEKLLEIETGDKNKVKDVAFLLGI